MDEQRDWSTPPRPPQVMRPTSEALALRRANRWAYFKSRVPLSLALIGATALAEGCAHVAYGYKTHFVFISIPAIYLPFVGWFHTRMPECYPVDEEQTRRARSLAEKAGLRHVTVHGQAPDTLSAKFLLGRRGAHILFPDAFRSLSSDQIEFLLARQVVAIKRMGNGKSVSVLASLYFGLLFVALGNPIALFPAIFLAFYAPNLYDVLALHRRTLALDAGAVRLTGNLEAAESILAAFAKSKNANGKRAARRLAALRKAYESACDS